MTEQDAAKVRSLVEQMASAEDNYGCGYYNQEAWRNAYTELLAMFGLQRGEEQ